MDRSELVVSMPETSCDEDGHGPRGTEPDRPDVSTLVELLRWRARHGGDCIAYGMLDEQGNVEPITYAELDARARAVAGWLERRGQAGDRALLVIEEGIELLVAFFGCLYAQRLAVPLAIPELARLQRTLPRLQQVAASAEPSCLLASRRAREVIDVLSLPWLQALPCLEPGRCDEDPERWGPPSLTPDDLAYLQYTSGSTRRPRGVMLSHGNLLQQLRIFDAGHGHGPGSVMVSWLPATHDLGMVYGRLVPLFGGFPCYFMAPEAFLRRPARWLEALHEHRATHTMTPNFGLELAVKAATPELLARLELSRLAVIINGAEPIRVSSERRFVRTFAPAGLRASALTHAMGMSEATAKIVSEPIERAPGRFAWLDPQRYERGEAVEVEPGSAGAIAVASNGRPALDTRIEIVDPTERVRLPPGRIGELWISGRTVAQGYFREPRATEETFGARLRDGDGPFLRTGDLGFVLDGELYLSGRLADLIIVRGHNHHPQDLEHSVEHAHPGLRPGCGVVLGVREADDDEQLVVVWELDPRALPEREAVFDAVQAALFEHGLRARSIVLIRPKTLPKTTSGKLQRGEARRRHREGTLEVLARRTLATEPEPRPAGEAGREPTPKAAWAERLLQEIARVLGLPDASSIAVDRPLVALGIDSLTAIELRDALQQLTGRALEPSFLLRQYDVRALVEALPPPEPVPGVEVEAVPEPKAAPEEAPLSPGQARLYFLHRALEQPQAYNVHLAARLDVALDPTRLQRAVDHVVARHEQLRMAFGERDGVPFQRPVAVHVPVEVLDLSTLAPAEAEAELEAVVAAQGQAPFELEAPPLVRVTLVKLGPQRSALALTCHHIVVDGWSLGVLLEQLSEAYAAEGDASPSLAPAPSFVAHAERMRAWLRSAAAEDQRRFWRAELEGAPPLELPTDHPRSAPRTEAGALIELTLDASLSDGIDALAQALGTTPFVVLLAGWAALLHRYSGQRDFVVGVIASGRDEPELRELVGFCANTLPVRCAWDGDPTGRALIQRLGERAWAALDHQRLPVDEILRTVPMAPHGLEHPLLRASFVLEDRSWLAARLGGAVLQPFGSSVGGDVAGTAKFELSLSMLRGDEGYRGSLELATSRLRPETVERMAEHLRGLLRAMVHDPEQPLSRLGELTPQEQRWLQEWNDTARPYPDDRCLHELVVAQAAATPHAVALSYEGRTCTYAALVDRASRLAHLLQARGVGPDRCVGIALPRGPTLVVAIVAVLLAGGAYVPLDPTHPPARLRARVEDAGLVALLAHADPEAGPRPSWCPGGVTVIDPDLLGPTLAGLPAHPPTTLVDPDDLAYVIYTSGSTGAPKGVAVAHRSVVNLVHHEAERFDLRPGTPVLQFSSITFDASVSQIFTTLTRGGRLVLANEEQRRFGPALMELMQAEAVEIADLPPAALGLLDEARLATLRVLVVGGEACPLTQARRLAPGRRFVNAYGPTEATVTATYWEGRPDGFTLPIGRPCPNNRVHVLSPTLRPVPVGAFGELCIAGVGLARGYLGQPERTRERFVPDPFGPPGARLHRTGDRGRWRADGTLELAGRLDRQVKIRGIRIELGEVEAALGAIPGVEQHVVVARDDGQGGARLVAYVVGEALPSAAALREALARTLFEAMIPSAFVVLPALPLTPSGKVDVGALPEPAARSSLLSSRYEEPRTAIERGVAEVWAAVLGVERVGLHDDFFELGGHSLSTTQVASRLADRLGVEVSLRRLLEARTVAAQARAIESLEAAEPGRALEPIPLVDRRQRVPLSFAQSRLWFEAQLHPDRALYHVPVALWLRGVLDASALARAVDGLVERHEALRTTFPSRAGLPWQHVVPPRSGVLEREALPPVPPGEDPRSWSQRYATRWLEAEARRPFALAEQLPLRARVLALEPESHVLLLTMHHVATDGWSLGVLMRELGELYRAFAAGRVPSLPPLPLQYPDYAAWERARWAGPERERLLAHWRERLHDAPSLELPASSPRPARPSRAGAHVPVQLPAELSRRLEALALAHGQTLFTVLLAAFAVLLHRLGGQRDLVVCTPVANRPRRELEGLVGSFTNTLALRLDLSGEPTFAALLSRVEAVRLDAFEHAAAPLEQVVEALGRDPGHAPLVQAMLVLQSTPLPAPALGDELEVEVHEVETGTSALDLTLSLTPGPAGLHGVLEHDAERFEPATIERWLGCWRVLLEGIVDDPRRSIGALPLLRPAERRRLLVEPNGTARPLARDRCVHALVAAQAEARPEAIAVEHDGATLTYRELVAAAHRLAHALRELGVGVEARVGVHLERSLDAIVALLGVLAAGAAYVPLDPEQPLLRRRTIARNATLTALVTHAALVARDGDPAPSLPRLCLDIDTDAAVLAAQPITAPTSGVSATNLAYVLHTSGSTGRPKGVEVAHLGLLNLVAEAARIQGYGPGRRGLVFASLGFDGMVHETWSALCSGATLVIASHEERLSSPRLSARLATVDIATLTPTVLATLDPDAGVPSACLAVAGEACPRELAQRWASRVPVMLNLYGPTEATVTAAYHHLDPAVLALDERPPPIGRPIANTRLYVLDDALEPVPVGVSGELCIAGVGLALGYLGDPAATAARFVADPFGAPGERLYRTGDRCRRRPDGVLELVGRIDDQVKIRGARIEPGEIEAALLAHPEVRDAAVVVAQGGGAAPELVAHVVASPPRRGQLRDWLRERLPAAMVPARFVTHEALPRTPHGKVDRAALRRVLARDEPEAAFVPPCTELEATMAAIWAEVLGRPRVGRDDDFFALGGHSLLAVQVVGRMQDALGLEVPVRSLFAAPTIARLAQALARSGSAAPVTAPIVPLPRDGSLPLSFEQERAWRLEQRPQWSGTSNLVSAHRLTGPLDRAALLAALATLVARHEALRTSVAVEQGQPRQRVRPPEAVTVHEADLSSLAPAARTAALTERIAAEANRRFPGPHEPLFRAQLLTLGPDDHALLLAIHHLVCDGWSMGVLMTELRIAYQAHARGEAPSLPPLPIQPADHAAWQRTQLSGPALERLLQPWREHLRGAPVLELPTDHPRPAVLGDRGATVPLSLSRSLTEALEALVRTHETTLFTVLLAAWQLLLGQRSGQRDVVVGTLTANRTRPELEGLVGCFVNLLALRTDLSGDPSFVQLLGRARATALAAQEHQAAPIDRVIEALGAEDRPDRRALFTTMVVLQNAASAPWSLADDVGLEPLPLPPDEVSRFDLMLSLTRRDPGLRGILRYSTALFEPSTIAALRDQLVALLHAIADDPGRPCSVLARTVEQPG